MKKIIISTLIFVFLFPSLCLATPPPEPLPNSTKEDPYAKWISAKNSAIKLVQKIKQKYDIESLDKSSKEYDQCKKALDNYNDAANHLNMITTLILKDISLENFNVSSPFEKYDKEMQVANVYINLFYDSANFALDSKYVPHWAYGAPLGNIGAIVEILPKTFDFIIKIYENYQKQEAEKREFMKAFTAKDLTWPTWDSVNSN